MSPLGGKIKIHLEYGELKEDIEGADVQDVLRALSAALSKVPGLELVAKLTYAPDVLKLADGLSGLVTILPEGPALAGGVDLQTSEAIVISLAAARIGAALGKFERESLPIQGISMAVRKAEKTVSNEIIPLMKSGLVERIGRGEYRVTTLGMKELEERIIPGLKAGRGERDA